jgi:FdhD protein
MVEIDRYTGRASARYRVWHVDTRKSDSGIEAGEIEIAIEEPLSLMVNGAQLAVLMRLPGMEKELAAGYLVSEGLVGRFDDILTIHHCGQGLPGPGEYASEDGAEWRNRVEVRVRDGGLRPDARMDTVRLIRAGCGAVEVAHIGVELPILPKDVWVPARTLLKAGTALRRAKGLRENVGGIHTVGIYGLNGSALVNAEDVGRHNAVDKAAGHCLLRGVPLDESIMVCSGRLSYEMASKAVRLGIRVVASLSGPTALAMDLADRCGLTLVGYLRAHRMIVYTHPERVTPDKSR